MILSVGYQSVKLTSILRDTVVDIDGHGSTKINAAYAYGGAELAMRTVNQTFQMNITKYVVVDYLTIARLVDAVGGVDIVISQAEMEQINANNSRYAGSTRVAEDLGYMPAPVREYSEDGETPVHLDGLQAVGYARIRKLDSDFMRTFAAAARGAGGFDGAARAALRPGDVRAGGKGAFWHHGDEHERRGDMLPGHESAGLRADRADAPARGRHV